MTPYEIAKTYIGTTEGPGPQNNPVIVQMGARPRSAMRASVLV